MVEDPSIRQDEANMMPLGHRMGSCSPRAMVRAHGPLSCPAQHSIFTFIDDTRATPETLTVQHVIATTTILPSPREFIIRCGCPVALAMPLCERKTTAKPMDRYDDEVHRGELGGSPLMPHPPSSTIFCRLTTAIRNPIYHRMSLGI